jgi:hypothetical protein
VKGRLPLWSSGQSSWLQIQRSGFDSLHYQIFWEVVGLKRGPLNLMTTSEELLGRKSSSSGVGSREYGHRDPSHWPHSTLYPQKLALTLLISGSRSDGIVFSRTEAMEFSFSLCEEHFKYFGLSDFIDLYSFLKWKYRMFSEVRNSLFAMKWQKVTVWL